MTGTTGGTRSLRHTGTLAVAAAVAVLATACDVYAGRDLSFVNPALHQIGRSASPGNRLSTDRSVTSSG